MPVLTLCLRFMFGSISDLLSRTWSLDKKYKISLKNNEIITLTYFCKSHYYRNMSIVFCSPFLSKEKNKKVTRKLKSILSRDCVLKWRPFLAAAWLVYNYYQATGVCEIGVSPRLVDHK